MTNRVVLAVACLLTFVLVDWMLRQRFVASDHS
jgi:hypothetical protein